MRGPSRGRPLTIPPLPAVDPAVSRIPRATGALHVLMGADHLCALAVVAAPGESDLRPSGSAPVDTKKKTHFATQTFLKSTALGVRWGLGHAAGLALVCLAFFSAKGAVSLDGVGDVTDKVVGASMVLLGVLALAQLRAWRRRRALERAHLNDALANAAADLQPHAEGRRMDLEARSSSALGKGSVSNTKQTAFDHDQTAKQRTSSNFAPLAVQPGSAAHAHAHDLDLPHVHREARMEEKDASDVELGVSSEDVNAVSAEDEPQNQDKTEPSVSDEAKARSRWSFAIGFSHGVASPSGILSVLPAVVLDDSAKASAYLVAFFITSTASMGAFAGAFGLAATAAAVAARPKAPANAPMLAVDVMKNATRYADAFAESSRTTAGKTERIPLGLATPCEKPMAKDQRERAFASSLTEGSVLSWFCGSSSALTALTSSEETPSSTSDASFSSIRASRCTCGRSRSCACACAALPG